MNPIPEISYFPRTATALTLFYHCCEALYVYIFLGLLVSSVPLLNNSLLCIRECFYPGACLEGPALSKDCQGEPAQFVPIAYLLR